MPRRLQYLFAAIIFALLVGGPVGYASYRRTQSRNFRVVVPGVLYRSGQMSLAGLKQAVHDHQIKTVVTLRAAGRRGAETEPDDHEEAYCKAEEMNFFRIPPPEGWIDEKPVRDFLAVMADPANHPVLVHCFAGVHRTGAYCAAYRMECQRWSNAEAIAELKAAGYTNLDDEWDILGFLETFRPSWRAQGPTAPRRPLVRPGVEGK